MTHVVTDNCIKCKYTDCVEVCPVDCFHEGPNFLVIDPEECIDCTLCVAECPAEAIFVEHEVPDGQQHYLALNAELARRWPVIDARIPAPPRPAGCRTLGRRAGQAAVAGSRTRLSARNRGVIVTPP